MLPCHHHPFSFSHQKSRRRSSWFLFLLPACPNSVHIHNLLILPLQHQFCQLTSLLHSHCLPDHSHHHFFKGCNNLHLGSTPHLLCSLWMHRCLPGLLPPTPVLLWPSLRLSALKTFAWMFRTRRLTFQTLWITILALDIPSAHTFLFLFICRTSIYPSNTNYYHFFKEI